MMLYDVDLPGGLEHVILLFLLVGQSLWFVSPLSPTPKSYCCRGCVEALLIEQFVWNGARMVTCHQGHDFYELAGGSTIRFNGDRVTETVQKSTNRSFPLELEWCTF
jgi:hypothetical protein